MHGCISQMAHTHIPEPVSPPKASERQMPSKSKNSNSKTVKDDKQVKHAEVSHESKKHNDQNNASATKKPGSNFVWVPKKH